MSLMLDGKVQTLCAVHRHHPNPFSSLLDNRRVLHLPGFRIGIHAFHEGPERGCTAPLEASGQIDHAQAVGQCLLARWPPAQIGIAT
jgi:hypothetical protein